MDMTHSEYMNGIEVVSLISRHVILKEPQNRIKLRLHKKGSRWVKRSCVYIP